MENRIMKVVESGEYEIVFDSAFVESAPVVGDIYSGRYNIDPAAIASQKTFHGNSLITGYVEITEWKVVILRITDRSGNNFFEYNFSARVKSKKYRTDIRGMFSRVELFFKNKEDGVIDAWMFDLPFGCKTDRLFHAASTFEPDYFDLITGVHAIATNRARRC